MRGRVRNASVSTPNPTLAKTAMTRVKPCLAMLVGGVILVSRLGIGSAEGPEWNDAMRAAQKAFDEVRYADAERSLRIAVTEAEKFASEDRRLATSIGRLGLALYFQGKYAEAEEVYLQALAVLENRL